MIGNQRNILDKFLKLRSSFSLSLVFFSVATILTLINTLLNYPYHKSVDFQYALKLLAGGALGNIAVYLLKGVIFLFVLHIFFKKKIEFKKIITGLIACDLPISLSILITIVMPSLVTNGVNSIACNMTSLCYFLGDISSNKYLFSFSSMIDFFELWRIILLAYLLNILGDVKIYLGILLSFLINYVLLALSF